MAANENEVDNKVCSKKFSCLKYLQRFCCCGWKKKAKMEDKKEPTPQTEETTTKTDVTTTTKASPKQETTDSNQVKVNTFKDNLNVTKVQELRKSLQKRVSQPKDQVNQVVKRSRCDRVISRRDRERLEERRTKLKLLKNKATTQSVVKQKMSKRSLKNPKTPETLTLPVGVRGFTQGPTGRQNRFALAYIAENKLVSSNSIPQKKEMETLFRLLTMLNSNWEIVQHSYKDVVRSLIRLQVPSKDQNRIKELSSHWNAEWMSEKPCNPATKPKRNYTEKIDTTVEQMTLKRLLAPDTRDDAMDELQELVEELNVSLDDLHVYYDDEKNEFDFEEWKDSEFRITREEYKLTLRRTEMLLKVVEQLVDHYFNNMIGMFELSKISLTK